MRKSLIVFSWVLILGFMSVVCAQLPCKTCGDIREVVNGIPTKCGVFDNGCGGTMNCECPQGYNCTNGACMQTITGCTDSDQGLNYNLFGEVIMTYSAGSRTGHKDCCAKDCNPSITDLNALVEMFCPSQILPETSVSVVYSCPYGCSNGTCCPQNAQCLAVQPTPTQCTDTDGGKDYYTKGKIRGYEQGQYREAEDKCTTQPPATSTGEALVVLQEGYCTTDGRMMSEQITCPQGCRDGVCIKGAEGREDCKSVPFKDADGDGCHAGFDSDCGGIEGVDNPEVTCMNGKDDDCDGMIDEKDNDLSCNLKCGDGTCGWHERIEASRYYCSLDCEKEIENPENCFDSDGGDNIFVQGSVSGLEMTGIWDKWTDYCGVSGEENGSLVEYVCTEKDYGRKILHKCDGGCRNGVCMANVPEELKGYKYAKWQCYNEEIQRLGSETTCKSVDEWTKESLEFCDNKCNEDQSKCGVNSFGITAECYLSEEAVQESELIKPEEVDIGVEICKDACALDGRCYQFGYRKSGNYCYDTGEWEKQKLEDEICDNNWECLSNICVDGKCLSSNVIQKIIEWFRRVFG